MALRTGDPHASGRRTWKPGQVLISGTWYNRLRKSSPSAGIEGGLIAAVEADLARERPVWLEFGGAGAGSRVHLVEALPGEANPVRAVAAVGITVDRTERELAAALGVEGDV